MPIDTSTLTVQEQITAIYVAYYDRAPDPAGLQFWVDQLQNGRSLDTIAADFAGAAETKSKYPYFDQPDVAGATTFITSVYVNLFGRTPDDAGRDFWVDQLTTGKTPVGEIILAILEGARDVTGGTDDQTTVLNKIDVALDWATSAADNNIGTTTNLIAEEVNGQLVVNNATAFTSAQTILDGVDGTAASVTAAKAATDAFIAAGGGVGATFTLTTGADTLGNSSSNGVDTFVATDTTLTAGDNLNGGGGNDTLNYSASVAAALTNEAAFTMTSIETLSATVDSATPTDTVAFDLSGATGLQAARVDNSSASVAFNQLANIVDVEINNLTGAAGTTTVQFQDSVVAGTSDAVNLTVNDAAIGTLTIGSVSSANTGVETVNIATAGQATTIGTLNTALSTLNVSGDQNLTITTLANATLVDVNADTMTGGLTMGFSASASDIAVDTGTGDDNINASANTGDVTANLGAGDDLINMGANMTSTDTVDGGADSDTLAVDIVATAANGAGTAAGETFANTTNIETLQFTAVTGGTLDAGEFVAVTNTDGSGAVAAGVTTYDFDGGLNAGVILQNVADNSTVMVDDTGVKAGAAGQAITVTNATDGAADTTNLVFDIDTANDATGAVTLNTAETINVAVNDAIVPPTAGAVVNGVTLASLSSTDMTTLNVTGNGNFTVAGVITTGALATVDASGSTGALSINIDDVTDVSAATAQNVSVTSNNANDTITLGGANNFGSYTVSSGNGDDAISLTSDATATAAAHTVTAGDSDTTTVGNGTITVAGGASATVTAGDNGWTVTTDTGADNITTGAGADIINAGTGNDTVVAGAGNDIITAGRGVDNLSGGDGDDQFNFVYGTTPATEGITSADTVDGGAGTDTLNITTANVTLTDQIYNNLTSVEGLDLVGNGTNSVTVNSIALAAGLQTIKGGSGNDAINVGEGFSNALTIDLSDGGNDNVNAALAPGAMTITAEAGDITAADTIVGGTSSNDVLAITADNGTATVSGMSAVETINILQDTTSAITEEFNATLVLGADSVVTTGSTLTVDATAMTALDTDADDVFGSFTFDGSAELTGTATAVNLISGAGNDTVTMTAGNDTVNTGAGDDVIIGGAGQDALTGGAGDDDYVYNALTDSNGTTLDTIFGFETSTSAVTNDEIVVANTIVGNRTTATFVGNAANFADAQSLVTLGSGETQYVFQQDANTLWIDANDDGTLNNQDIRIVLDGVTALNTTNNTDVRVVVDSEIASFTGTTRTDTLAIVADNIGDGPNDQLTLNDTADISGLTVTGWENVIIAAGATVTMTQAQHDTTVLGAATTVTATGTQTINIFDTANMTGRTDIENYDLLSAGADTFTIGTLAQNVTFSGAGADTLNVSGTVTGSYVGAGANDVLAVSGTTDITGATIGGDFDTLTAADGTTLTLSEADHDLFTTAINGTGTQTFIVNASDGDNDLNADADIETYILSDNFTAFTVTAVGQNVTVNNGANVTIDTTATVDSISGTWNGTAGGTVAITADAGDDFRAATLSGIDTFDATGLATGIVFLDASNLDGIAAISLDNGTLEFVTDPGGTPATFNIGSKLSVANTGTTTLSFDDGGGNTPMIANITALDGDLDAIAGDSNDDPLTLNLTADQAHNLSGFVVTNVQNLTALNAAGDDITLNSDDFTTTNFLTVTGEGTSDLVLAVAAATDLTNTTISGFDEIDATAVGANDISIDAASISGNVTVIANAGADLLITETGDYSNITVTSGDFDSMVITDGATVTATEALLDADGTVTSMVSIDSSGAVSDGNLVINMSGTTLNLGAVAIGATQDVDTTINGTAGNDIITLADSKAAGSAMTVNLASGGNDVVRFEDGSGNVADSMVIADAVSITGYTAGGSDQLNFEDALTTANNVKSLASGSVDFTTDGLVYINNATMSDFSSIAQLATAVGTSATVGAGESLVFAVSGSGASSGQVGLFAFTDVDNNATIDAADTVTLLGVVDVASGTFGTADLNVF